MAGPATSSGPVADLSRHFAVVVHDVAPPFLNPLAAILDALGPRVGGRLVGAVVPCWKGVPLGSGGDAGFLRLVRSGFGEVLQHGYTHHQPRPGVVALATGRSDELTGLSTAEARDRIGRGRAILAGTLGTAVDGFVPPAWRTGRATPAELARLGFRYLGGFGALRFADATAVPLATWSWDWGVVGPLGRVGEGLADLHARLRPSALPCVVVHPADVGRGHLPRAVRVVDRLLGQGRTPLTFADLAAAGASP